MQQKCVFVVTQKYHSMFDSLGTGKRTGLDGHREAMEAKQQLQILCHLSHLLCAIICISLGHTNNIVMIRLFPISHHPHHQI